MENKNVLAKPFYVDKPREGAPDFIKHRIGVKVDEAIELLKTYKNDNGYVNLELLKKKDGTGHYLQVNTYGLAQPTERPPEPDETWRHGTGAAPIQSEADTIRNQEFEDLPF